ncbi:uncharacterized protein FIBRA_00739 [Fibroporia radiculosa]|uniref:Major facilitator superfamily (MFS) profile domain-containing protein n=1 Tax=Fibroporia radiculosa TaxID=599839 RepID=J4H0L1_9APHY|nr:uncharacterized protein FIBRA_00739 [Fibroporia radiculosa]CCL98734.1 predicted protein [Fibroporia radiculosa]
MTGFAAIPIAEEGGEENDNVHLSGVAKVLGPRWLQLPALTIGLLGVQVFWSIEMSYGTPYLISLGLSKSAVATVFLAGPVSGLVVQPLIGVLADNSKSRFGRRRPYMIGGTCFCVAAMLLLGYTRPFASLFTPSGSVANNILTIWLAIIALFSVDFSINAVQAVDRALLVDTLPSSEQADGNAWAARMLGVGSVAGYFIGNVDLTAVFSFLGETELEVLSVLGSFLLVSMHVITAMCTKERMVVATNAWLGWFPVLFYTTAFIGELHKRAHPDIPSDEPELSAEATRLGSRAMFFSAVLSLAANVVLPFFVSEAGHSQKLLERKLTGTSSRWVIWYERIKVNLATLWAISHLLFAACMAATFLYSGVAGATFFTTLTGFSWSITQWAPFSLLAEAILTEGVATDDTGSIMLQDTRTQHRSMDLMLGGSEQERQRLVVNDDDEADGTLEAEVQSFSSSASMDGQDEDTLHARRHEFMTNASARISHLALSADNAILPEGNELEDKHRGGLAAKAGIILGIHNIFIVMPQFVMTGIASIIFAVADSKMAFPGNMEAGNSTLSDDALDLAKSDRSAMHLSRELTFISSPNSYAIIFRLGGIAATIAFVLTIRLARELRRRLL